MCPKPPKRPEPAKPSTRRTVLAPKPSTPKKPRRAAKPKKPGKKRGPTPKTLAERKMLQQAPQLARDAWRRMSEVQRIIELARAHNEARDEGRRRRAKKDKIERRQIEKREGAPRSSRKTKVALSAATVELVARELCRRTLLSFTRRFTNNYVAGWAHKDICKRLERFMRAVAEGKSPRLMISMPPRSGKTQLASRMFPAWVLGHHPSWEIIAASYGVSLPVGFSRTVKRVIQDPTYRAIFPETAVDESAQATTGWLTTDGGGYLPAGVMGPITGRGAHCLGADTRCDTLEYDSPRTMRQIAESDEPIHVLTPAGYRRVLASAHRTTNEIFTLRFGSGAILHATAEHPIYMPDSDEYVCVGALYLLDTKPRAVRLCPRDCYQPDPIMSITRDRSREVEVYDIQVEEQSCFFAEGILVHNCLILDDLVKDSIEADSEVQRDRVWDWYGSVAKTRSEERRVGKECRSRWSPYH